MRSKSPAADGDAAPSILQAGDTTRPGIPKASQKHPKNRFAAFKHAKEPLKHAPGPKVSVRRLFWWCSTKLRVTPDVTTGHRCDDAPRDNKTQ